MRGEVLRGTRVQHDRRCVSPECARLLLQVGCRGEGAATRSRLPAVARASDFFFAYSYDRQASNAVRCRNRGESLTDSLKRDQSTESHREVHAAGRRACWSRARASDPDGRRGTAYRGGSDIWVRKSRDFYTSQARHIERSTAVDTSVCFTNARACVDRRRFCKATRAGGSVYSSQTS